MVVATQKKLILNRYKIQKELGCGGFSTVYKAFDTKMERLVAIKFIPADSKATTWAKREAKTSAHLNHPGIATIYEYEETDDGHYLIMEYLEGQTLREILDKLKKLQIDEAIAINSQVAIALEYAHLNFVIHKDIKPENLMILADGRVKIMDFGTARLQSLSEAAKRTLIGTPNYMSPEQISREITDDRSDQFSLAVVLYEILTGKTPFEGKANQEILNKVKSFDPRPASALRKDVSSTLDKAILRALSKNKDDRFETITDFRYKAEKGMSLNSKSVVKKLFERLDGKETKDDLPKLKSNNIVSVLRDIIGAIYVKNKTFVNKIFCGLLLAYFSYTLLEKLVSGQSRFIPVAVIFLTTLIFPLAGVVFSAIILVVKSFNSSLQAGFLSMSLVSGYLAFYSLKWPLDSIFPVFAIILNIFGAKIVYPLMAGLSKRPLKAAVQGAIGAALLSFYAPLSFNIKSSNNYLIILLHIGLWAGVSFIVSVLTVKRRLGNDVIALFIGIFSLISGYLLIFKLSGQGLEKIMQSASLSLIIALVMLAFTPYEHIGSRGER